MAYTDINRRPVSPTALALVTALHLGVGYLLVTGLGVAFVPDKEKPFVAITVPLDKPIPTPPDPAPSAKPKDPAPSIVTVIDTPFVMPSAAPTFTPGPVASSAPVASGSGIDAAAFPTPTASPSPTPSALFTPRAARPRGEPGTWVTANDYPTRDIREEHEGTTGFRVSVGTNGRVTNCTVTRSSGWPGLDAATCAKVTSRSRFEPATDETGANVVGSWSYTVKWQLPKD